MEKPSLARLLRNTHKYTHNKNCESTKEKHQREKKE